MKSHLSITLAVDEVDPKLIKDALELSVLFVTTVLYISRIEVSEILINDPAPVFPVIKTLLAELVLFPILTLLLPVAKITPAVEDATLPRFWPSLYLPSVPPLTFTVPPAT